MRPWLVGVHLCLELDSLLRTTWYTSLSELLVNAPTEGPT